MVTGHYPGRVPPFGYLRINVYLQLPAAFRSLSRPSSAISALASTLRSFSLDLASTIIPFLRLLRWNDNLICEFHNRFASDWNLPLRSCFFYVFPVQFSRCVLGCPLALRAGRSYAGRCPSEPATASRMLRILPRVPRGLAAKR